MPMNDYSLAVLPLLPIAGIFTGIGLINAIASGNGVLIVILSFVVIVEVYFALSRFAYHRFIKYAGDDTYAFYHISGYGARDLLAAATDATVRMIWPKMTPGNLKEFVQEGMNKVLFAFYLIVYRNNGGGAVIFGSDVAPDTASPSIKGYAPIDNFAAKTRVRDITAYKISRILKMKIEVPLTRWDRFKMGAHYMGENEVDLFNGTKLVIREVPILFRASTDIDAVRFMAKLQGLASPEFKSPEALVQFLGNLGDEYIRMDARQHEEREKALVELVREDGEVKRMLMVRLLDRGRHVIPREDEEQTGIPTKKHNWTKIAALVIAVLIASAGLFVAYPYIAGYVQTPESVAKLAPGEYYVVFYQSGLAPDARWTVNLGGYNNTHTDPKNNYVAFVIHDGVYDFRIYSPQGYAAQPPSGHLSINGSSLQQSVNFVRVNR